MTVLAQICLIVGLGLLLAECFIPGFGVCGFTGIALTAAYIVITAIYTRFGIYIIVGELAVVGVIVAAAFRYVRRKQLHGRLILDESLAESPRDVFDLAHFVGQTGKSKTSLRPQGVVDFNGSGMDARSDIGYIAENTYVTVTGVDGSLLVVKSAENA